MKTTVGVMGASICKEPHILALAYQTGRLIAERSAVLITGATNGLPLEAARGAKEAGGEVIGFSPAMNVAEHRRFGLPLDYHDVIVYSGLSFKGRNLLNVRASAAIVFIGGSMGALNEFTIAYDEEKTIGILQDTGGFCNHLEEWMADLAKPGNRAVLHYSREPELLISKLFSSLRIE